MVYLNRMTMRGDEALVSLVKGIFGDCRMKCGSYPTVEFTLKLVKIGDNEEHFLYHLVPNVPITYLVPPDRSVTVTYLGLSECRRRVCSWHAYYKRAHVVYKPRSVGADFDSGGFRDRMPLES